MDDKETKRSLPEEEYLKRMSSLPKIKAPGDFLRKVHERIERRSAFEKITRALFVPVRVKVPLELAAMAAAILIVSTIGIKKPVELALLIRTEVSVAEKELKKSVAMDRIEPEMALRLDSAKAKKGYAETKAPDALSQVKSQVALAQGKITNVETDKETSAPQYVDADIPAADYAKFIEYLSSIGTLQEPVLREAPRGRGVIQVRVRLLTK